MSYVATTFVFGEQPSAAKWNQLGGNDASFNDGTGIGDSAVLPRHLLTGTGSTNWVWQSWTPTWTNLTVGNGTLIYGKYLQHGKTVRFRMAFKLGTTSSVSGQVIFSLPVTAIADEVPGSSELNVIGYGDFLDSGINQFEIKVCIASTTTASTYANGASGTYATPTATSGTIPGTWGTNDVLSVRGFYEAA